MSQGPGQPVYQQPYPYQPAQPPPQGYYAPPPPSQQYQQQQQQASYGQLPPPSSSFQPQPPPPQQHGWQYPQQQAPPPQVGYGYAPPPSVAPAGYQSYYGQQPPPAQAQVQMVGAHPPQQQHQTFVPGVPHPAQLPPQGYPYPNPYPQQQQPGYGPPPPQPWQPSSSQPSFGHPPPPSSIQHPPYPPSISTAPSPYAPLPLSMGRPPPPQPGSPLSTSNSVRYSASNPPRSSYPVAAPPLQLAQPQPQPLASPLPSVPPNAPPPGKYPSQIPSALSPLPSATISPLNRGPPLSSPNASTPPHPRPTTSTTSSFSSNSSTPSSSSRPLPPPHPSASSRRLPPLATTGIRPGSSYDGIGSPATASSPSTGSRPPLPSTPGGSSSSAGGRPLPSPARDRSGSSPVVTSSRPLPASSSSGSSTDLNRSDTVSSVKSLDLNGGRPLPRPPGGVANSKSLDRGVGEGGGRGFGTAAGGRGDSGASDSSELLQGGASGIARAATLPSGAPQAAYSTPTRRGSDLPTLPSLPQPPRTAIPLISTSPSAPVAPTLPSISTTPIPTIDAPAPAIVEPPQPSPSSGSPSTPVRSHPPPPEFIIRTSPSPSQKIPVITELSSPSSPTKSGPPGPFIVPIFSFPSGDDDDDEDDHSNHHHHSREPSAPQITLSASPKASEKTPLPPMPPAKVSTASEQSTTKKRGGVVCEGCGEIILGKLIAGSAGMVWHPKCYKCTTCGLQLEHVSPYEQEGKLYCHFDYHELFTTRCYTCKTPIVDERFFTVNSPSAPTLSRYYHELHFFCSECGDPFLDPLRSTAAGGTGRDEEEDQGVEEEMKIHWWKDHPFCEKCDVKLHNPKCAKCRLALEGEYLEALGGKWHPGCLVCDSCEKEFENGRIFQWEEVPLCEPCFELIRRDDL